MKLPEHFLKMIEITSKFENQLGGAAAISKMVSSQKLWQNDLKGLDMQHVLLKSIGQHDAFNLKKTPSLDAMEKSIAMLHKLNIPSSTFEAINSIGKQHEQLFGNLKAITEVAGMSQLAFLQMKNLQFALNGISSQMVAIAIKEKNWSLIEDLENINQKAIKLAETFSKESEKDQEKEQETQQENEFQKFLTFVLSFINKHKSSVNYSQIFLTIFFYFPDAHQYYDFLKEKPELATKADINKINLKQDSINHYIRVIAEQLKQRNETRKTNRNCDVKLKPKSKTFIISKIPKGFELVVLQVHHKWVLVNFFDPKDNLPQTGWVLKKYIDKSE